MTGVMTSLQQLKDGCLHALSSRLTRWTKPLTSSLPLSTLADLSRSKSELGAENALLRQQLLLLRRQVKRPACTKTDRILLVLLARLVRTWQQTHITRATRHEAREGRVSSSAWSGSASLVLTQRSGGCKLERVDSSQEGKGSCKRSNEHLHKN